MTDHGFGVVAMAAFRPDPELFRRQLKSIQAQTYSDFLCLISTDGDADEVKALVAESTGDDPRFRVLGHGDRLGFYLNFERVLLAAPDRARWVALSDQDDEWYADKLETLLPHLKQHALVAGQARVVSDAGAVLLAKTPRRVVPFADLLIQNQITGAHSVFRRELLDLALPFPRLRTMTQAHDHWLAVCAAATDGYCVVDEPLQDYIQHANNVIGEEGIHRSRVSRLIGRVRSLYRAEGLPAKGWSLAGAARTLNRLSFGWRGVMADELAARLVSVPKEVALAQRAMGRRHKNVDAARFLLCRLRSGNVEGVVLATFLPGLPSEVFRPLREPRQRAAPLEMVN